MAKQQYRKETFSDRLRELLEELGRLFNPPRPALARIPVRVRDR